MTDIIIVGAGVVGLTTALALSKGAPDLEILVLDSKPLQPTPLTSAFDARVFAINHTSRLLWQKLTVWERIKAQRLSPYAHMQVWEADKAEITFHASDANQAELGFIIEQSVIVNALMAAVSEQPNIHCVGALQLQKAEWTEQAVSVIAENGEHFQAQCLIAADGAQSWSRRQAAIPCHERPYQQHALITTVQMAKPHQATASQHFLASGPLAFLPLADPLQGSIVWSLDEDCVREKLDLSDVAFCQALTVAFNQRLGSVLTASPRHAFALIARLAERLVGPRVALVGDAAHTIHPLAGQGVNLGLQDAACLAEVIVQATQKQRDFAGLHTLRRYERARQADHQRLLGLMRGFKELFASSNPGLRLLRQQGLQWADKSPWIKRKIIAAAG